jgi:hypothetical protein
VLGTVVGVGPLGEGVLHGGFAVDQLDEQSRRWRAMVASAEMAAHRGKIHQLAPWIRLL